MDENECRDVVRSADADGCPLECGELGKSDGVWLGARPGRSGIDCERASERERSGIAALYPGAKPHRDAKGDDTGDAAWIMGSSFGFKLVVLKMESNDAPEKVAAFYKKALAEYGTVLGCSDVAKAVGDKAKKESSKQLECGDDKPDAGGMLFKAGTKEKQHIVGIQTNGAGSVFQLVYVDTRWAEEEKKAL